MSTARARTDLEFTRRTLLSGAAGLVAAASFTRSGRTSASAISDINLSAAPGQWPIAGKSYPPTEVWCYGNRIPGPEFRMRQGERARIVVHNNLPEDTTVHWHGIRLPNAM